MDWLNEMIYIKWARGEPSECSINRREMDWEMLFPNDVALGDSCKKQKAGHLSQKECEKLLKKQHRSILI